MFIANDMIFKYILEVIITFTIFILKKVINDDFNYDFNLKKMIKTLIIFLIKKQIAKQIVDSLYSIDFEKMNENIHYNIISSFMDIESYMYSNNKMGIYILEGNI